MRSDNSAPDPWWLYVLLCKGDRLYIGIAKDVEARFSAHLAGKGAFFTRLNRPVRVLACELHHSKSSALKAEYALKQLKTEEKWEWARTRGSTMVPANNADSKEDT